MLRIARLAAGYFRVAAAGIRSPAGLQESRWRYGPEFGAEEDRLCREAARRPRGLMFHRKARRAVRFYAGVPLPGGGVFYVLDPDPRPAWAAKDQYLLLEFARLAASQLPASRAGLGWLALESLDAAVILMDRQFRVRYWNAAAERIYEWPREEALGRGVSELVPTPRMTQAARRQVRREILARGCWRGELVQRSRSGRELVVDSSTVAIRDGNEARGAPAAILSINYEVSGQKRAEEQARLLESVALHANDGILVTRATGRDPLDNIIVFINAAFTIQTGYTLEELAGKTPRFLFGADADAPGIQRMRAALARNQPVCTEFATRHKDGSTRWLEINAVPLLDASGRCTHVISIRRDITARRQMQDAVQESAMLLRRVADSAPVIIWMSDSEGRCTFVNEAWTECTGRPRDAALGWGWLDAVHPADAAQLHAGVMAIRAHSTIEMEYRIVRPGGEVRWLLAHAKPEFRPDGTFAGHIGTSLDITERKRAEAALRASEERFRLAAGSASDVIYEADLASGRIQFYCPPEVRRALGGPLPADLASWGAMLHPEDRDWVMQKVRQTQECGTLFRETYRVIGADRRVRYVHDRATLLRDAAGKPCRWIGALTDISERTRAEAAQARLAAIVQSSADAIIGSNLDGAIQSWNRGAERLYGYTEQEALGQHVSMLLPSDSSGEAAEILAEVRAGQAVRDRETTRRRKDGSIVPVSLSVSPIIGSSGKLVGVSAIARNISERRKADEMIQRMNDSLRRLSTRLLHLQDQERRRIARELHDGTAQNLAALSMNLTVLAADAALPPGAREKITACLELAEQCSREVRALSYLLHPPLLDELGLAAALRSYADGFSQRTGIRLELKVPEGFGRVDPELELALFRIVQEGLSNVHRHAGSPTAAIRIRRYGAVVKLDLEDAGCGIRPEVLDGSHSPGPQLGVGIPGMRERVRQLGGTLHIRSGPGGTLLQVSLPVHS